MHVRYVVKESTDWSRHGECEALEEVEVEVEFVTLSERRKKLLWANLRFS
jgi:hypothetical protein